MVTNPLSKNQGAGAQPWRASGSETGQDAPWQQGEPPRVLIVEDDDAIRRLLVTVLSQQGFQTRAVATGEDGLVAVAEEPVHVLVTDYQLPDVDGVSLLEQVTRHDPRTVGILVTGHGTVELAVKAMKAGAADMITKPFMPNDVVMAIRRVLEMQHLRQENRVLKQAVMRGVRINPFHLSDIETLGSGSAGPNHPARAKSPDYVRGLADGERQARERLAKLRQQEAVVAEMGRQLAQACATLPERMEAQVVTLAFDIARKVVQACAEEKRDVVVAQTKDALARIHEAKAVRILVHPSEVALVAEAQARLADALDGPASIKIEGDPTVARGGCRVQTPTHLVDATVDGQLARIAERLRQVTDHEAR